MVRYYPDKTGKFNQRPHYEPKDLDLECEKIITSFLNDTHGKVAFPIETDDLTKLIEKNTSDLDIYADLTKYGENVEGVTEFIPKIKPKVSISSTVSELTWAENRFRTTMTHELGHVKFHGYLYEFELKNPSPISLQVCKRDEIVAKSNIPGMNWMEWQAGYACGAFLMPASYVKKAVVEFYNTSQKGITNPEVAEKMIDRVIEIFQVSQDAARVRLMVLGYIIR